MSFHINLEDIDADGAVREAADAVSGDTRLSFLKKAGVAGGAVVGGGAVLSALAPSALAATGHGRPPKSFGKGDYGILNYALTLEYLEAAFYNGASAANLPLTPQAAAFLKIVTRDENAHVAFLKKALGRHAVKQPKFDFKGANTSVETFMKTSEVLENTGVHAYLGQAPNIEHVAYAKAAASILTVEARHASVIGLLNDPTGESIAPNGPFDVPETAATVLATVKSTGFIV
ncbi:MAG TPA: ferritin-like domain-containing protein [Solirubrobacteraceae bacterium]|nr:ferritin-like domain-containing protein [Solirubrobacteraceae bacterium]